MTSAGEHIDRGCFREAVATGGEAENIAGKSCGIAGNVDYAFGRHGRDGLNGIGLQAFPGRIDNDNIRTLTAFVKSHGRLTSIGPDEVNIDHFICGGVLLSVFHGFGYNFRADDTPCLAGETETYCTGAAVEVQSEQVICELCILQRFCVKLFGLRRIDLKESLRSYIKVKTAKPVVYAPAAPERIKVAGQYGVAGTAVDVQYDAGELRAGLAQSLHQCGRLVSKAFAGNNAQQSVPALHGAAEEHMAHDAAAAFLIIGPDAVQVHKRRHGPGSAAAQRVLYKTVIDRDELVAAFAEKAAACLSVYVSDGEDRLIAVVGDSVAANDLRGLNALLTYTPQRVIDAAELEAQFILVAHVPCIAAAALAVIRTGGFDAAGSSFDEPLHPCIGAIGGGLDDFYFPLFTGESTGDKNCTAVYMAYAVCLRAEVFDGDGIYFVFLQTNHITNDITGRGVYQT